MNFSALAEEDKDFYKEDKEMNKYVNYFLMPPFEFKRACDMAYADMARHALRIDNKPEEEKKELRKRATNYLKDRCKALSCSSQAEFDKWHYETCKHLIEIYKDCKDCKDKMGKKSFCYGHAQKWLNMLFKYLYVYEFVDEFKNYFVSRSDLPELLHIPLDNKIIEKAEEDFDLQKPSCSWSRMDEEQYQQYQANLKEKVRSNPNPPDENPDGKVPFYWELMVWSTL